LADDLKAAATDSLKKCATMLGVGHLPLAPGTWASLVTVLLLLPLAGHPRPLGVLLGILGAVAVWSAGAVGSASRIRDPRPVVIDEALGMGIVFTVAAAGGLPVLVAGFILFRAFDVVKPWPLRRLEELPGGFGIVADDVGAAIYSIAVLKVVSAAGLI